MTKAEAAGAILSTADDMALWMQFHLSGGVTSSGKHLLTQHEMRAMYDVAIGGISVFPPDITRPSFPVSDVCLGYALGWISSVYRGWQV